MLFGSGFILDETSAKLLGHGPFPGIEKHIRGYRNGRDLTDKPRNSLVIDLYGTTPESVQRDFRELYQHVLMHVKPERDQNRDKQIRENWWLHGRPRPELRDYLTGLPRYIATVETSKHRFFTFLNRDILPDNKLIAIAAEDAFVLGVLSSSIHVRWSLSSGSWLGVGNDSVYVKTRCFETFPFPALEEGELKNRIRDLGERLDAHRKRQQELHPDLTLTGMYNVLEKLRSGEPLTAKEKAIHDQGLVTILKQLHDELDEAVLEAYGWGDLVECDSNKGGTGGSPVLSEEHGPASRDARAPLDEQELLARLVALNHERAAEEKRGLIRWLRPDYQAPSISYGHRPPLQSEIEGVDDDTTETPSHRNTGSLARDHGRTSGCRAQAVAHGRPRPRRPRLLLRPQVEKANRSNRQHPRNPEGLGPSSVTRGFTLHPTNLIEVTPLSTSRRSAGSGAEEEKETADERRF